MIKGGEDKIRIYINRFMNREYHKKHIKKSKTNSCINYPQHNRLEKLIVNRQISNTINTIT